MKYEERPSSRSFSWRLWATTHRWVVLRTLPPMPNMPEMRNKIQLKHAVAGRYSGTGQVAMAGRWEVTVIVRRGGKEIGNKRFNVMVQ